MRRGPWEVLDSRTIHENPWFEVRVDRVIRPDGEPGTYSVVRARRLACAAVPLWDDGTITLVGQHRYPISDGPDARLPAGERGDDGGHEPQSRAGGRDRC